MKKAAIILVVVLLVVPLVFIVGCGGKKTTETTTLPETTTPSETTTSPETTTPSAPTPTANQAVISLSAGRSGSPLHIDVTQGNYQITSGATLRQGSSIDVYEEWLTFPPGLVINIGSDGIVLKGNTYSQGTRLYVDQSGNLVGKSP